MKPIGSAVLCTLSVAFRLAAQTFLPGTAPLKTQGDLAAEMVDGINEYLVRATAESVAKRSATRPDRERLKEIIGAVDPRLPITSVGLDTTTSRPALVAKGQDYKIYAAHWPVFEGVTAEGLLIEPDHTPIARSDSGCRFHA